jgi:mevalonate kinase
VSTGRAPGKIILLGEHAVVYGHRAVAAAVQLHITVHLERRPGPTQLDQPFSADPRLRAALLAVLPRTGVGVRIHSELPIGRGMGSSAALAVALGRARAALEGEPCTPERLDRDAWAVERVFHGNPSGIDHTVSIMGGAIAYRKTPDGPQLEPIHLAPLPLVVIDSGTAGDTAAQVAAVRARRPEVDPIICDIGSLVEDAIPTLAAPDLGELGATMSKNHRLLQRLGVSTPALDQIVSICLSNGALGAKLAGAGGGGVVIALAEDRERLIQAMEQVKLQAHVLDFMQ